MKKKMCVFLAVVLLLTLIPVRVQAASVTNAEITYRYFRDLGYTPEASAAIVGNIMWESGSGGSFDFPLHTKETGGVGIGMCQWSYSRKTNFINFCNSKGVSWTDSTLEMQCEFLTKELNGDYGTIWMYYNGYSSKLAKYKMSLSQFKVCRDLDLATGAFCYCFERPAESGAGISTRLTYAKRVLAAFYSRPDDLGNDFYAAITTATGGLNVEATVNGGVRLRAVGNDTTEPRQIWHFVRNSDDTYTVTSVYDGLYLAPEGSGTTSGQDVQMLTTAFSWYVEGSGTYVIASAKNHDVVMDIYSNSQKASANVQLYTRNGTDAQNFTITPVSYEKPAAPAAVKVGNVSFLNGVAKVTWTESALRNAWDQRTYELNIWKKAAFSASAAPLLKLTGLQGTSTSVQMASGDYVFQVCAVNTKYPNLSTAGEYVTVSVAHTHNYDKHVVTAPGCYDKGYTTHTCTACGASYVDSYTGPAGHSWDNGRVTRPATGTTAGIMTYTCTRCQETRIEYLPVVGVANPFLDVKKTDYFYDAVLWALGNGIAAGTASSYFRPYEAATRAQVMTFLWRAAGRPEPKSLVNPFKDMSPSDYYYKAVLWSVEQGISAGVGWNLFSPEVTCTRSEIVTFLWRAAGKPEPKSSTNPFSDVGSWQYYYKAVLWATEQGICVGSPDGKFLPLDPCGRGQILTVIYRYYR